MRGPIEWKVFQSINVCELVSLLEGVLQAKLCSDKDTPDGRAQSYATLSGARPTSVYRRK